MAKKISVLVCFLLFGTIALAGLPEHLKNISYLSEIFLNDDSNLRQNGTVVPFPLYQLFVMLHKTASQEVKDELDRFFPYPIDDGQTAELASFLQMPATGKDASVLLSHLYLFSNDQKVKADALDFLNDPLFKNFVNHIQFSPEKGSIDKLNRKISDDHQGELQGPLDTKNLNNTIAFLVATLFVKSEWPVPFDDKLMFFKVNNTVKQVSSFNGTVSVRYHSDGEKTIVHVPASDNIVLAFKIYHDGFVAPIIQEELELEGTKAVISLEIPNFSIENSINLIDKIKDKLSETFTTGFKTLLSNDEVVINEFLQTNKLEVTKSGIKAVSVAKAKLVTRAGGPTATRDEVKIDRPFSFCLYSSNLQDHLPLLSGVVWDLPSNDASPKLDILRSMPAPEDTLQKSIFHVLAFLFSVRASSSEWGSENEVICPLSILLTLQRASMIYGIEPGPMLRNFQKIIGFELEITEQFIDMLIHNPFTTNSITDTWTIKRDESFDLDAAKSRCLGIDDEVKKLVKTFIDYREWCYDADGFVSNFAIIENNISETVDRISKLTEDDWEQIKGIDGKLIGHFYGNKDEALSTLSKRLLGEDNAKVLQFLKFCRLRENVPIHDPEQMRTAILGSRYILKNSNILLTISDEDWIRLFGLAEENVSNLKENTGNIGLIRNRINASSAYVNPNPSLHVKGLADHDALSNKSISIGLHLEHVSLIADNVPFGQGTISGFKGDVRGFIKETEQDTTVALHALGDLALIMQISNEKGGPIKPLLSFEGGSSATFSISFPPISAPVSKIDMLIPSEPSKKIQVASAVSVIFNIVTAPRQPSEPPIREIILSEPFSWAIAKVINHSDEAPPSYAILVTGAFNGN